MLKADHKEYYVTPLPWWLEDASFVSMEKHPERVVEHGHVLLPRPLLVGYEARVYAER